MYYESVFRALNEFDVRYVVAGGIAVVLHGVVRLTADLDLIIDLAPENVKKFSEAMENLGYRPKVPVKAVEFGDPEKRKEWIEKKGMRVFSFFHPKKQMELVDVFVNELIPFPELHAERMIITAARLKIPVISIKHLKKLKKIAGRPQDLADIRSLNNLEALERENK
ncbi:MAG: hypothetical protein NTZ78_03545 [Candidatus Aureabacteria bacterium]|nr:hypothetical protein [Candidatus Auribacterota bacterium]